jgi:tetratricopeptide (TPR) repeat protein
MRTTILLLAALLSLPSTLAAQVPQVPRGNTFRPDLDRVRRHYDVGWGMMRSEDWAGTANEFQQVIDIDPKFANAYYSLGRAEMGQRHFPKAIEAYLKCREVYVTSSGETYSNQLNGTRRLEDQVLETQMAIQQAQALSAAKSNSQSQSLYLKELQTNKASLEQARDRNQNLVVDTSVPFYVPMALGAAYQKSGKFEDAEREYKAAIEANSGSGESHSNLAVLYMMTGRLEDANRELTLAEKTGFKVNSQLKQDLEARRKGKS